MTKNKIRDFFLEEDLKKQTKIRKRNTFFFGFLSSLLAFVSIMSKVLNQDTSMLEQSDSSFNFSNNKEARISVYDENLKRHFINGQKYEQNENLSNTPRTQKNAAIYNRKKQIIYKATQVIDRGSSSGSDSLIPQGTNMIGRLLTSIDTREMEQSYKVFLPYGGNFKEGAEIPKGSILFGKVRYSGKGTKVFLTFTKGIYPDGREFEIQAQALNSRDYSPGITGDFHGQASSRIAATLGLSAISGAAAILTQRDAIGLTGMTLPKANLENALYGGVSQAAQSEAQRQLQSLNDSEEYVTVDAGKDLIINLTGVYRTQ